MAAGSRRRERDGLVNRQAGQEQVRQGREGGREMVSIWEDRRRRVENG